MVFKLVIVACLLLAAGCNRRFVNVGGTGDLPVEAVRAYAQQHGISYEEAARQISQPAAPISSQAEPYKPQDPTTAQPSQSARGEAGLK